MAHSVTKGPYDFGFEPKRVPPRRISIKVCSKSLGHLGNRQVAPLTSIVAIDRTLLVFKLKPCACPAGLSVGKLIGSGPDDEERIRRASRQLRNNLSDQRSCCWQCMVAMRCDYVHELPSVIGTVIRSRRCVRGLQALSTRAR